MRIKLFILFCFVSFLGFAQETSNGFKFWHLNSISGDVRVKGSYTEQERNISNFSDKQISKRISGGILLNTSSYFIHPNFLLVDLSAEYSPENHLENYLVIPDRAEQNALKRISINTTFFNKKKIIVSPFASWDQSYQNRENLTNIKSDNKQIGARLISSYNFLPLSVYFAEREWIQKEFPSSRTTKLNEVLFRSSLNKSFFKIDRNELNLSHNEYTNINVNAYEVKNIIDDINLHNDIYFDSQKKYHFNSNISHITNRGYIDYTRFQAIENLALKLPLHLSWLNTYNYNDYNNNNYNLKQHTINSSLNHKLYKSLNSKLFTENNIINHTQYNQFISKNGTELTYTKKIPTDGQLNLYYRYYKYFDKMTSEPSNLFTMNEEYYLVDNQITLLKKPYVDKTSIVVKDITGTIIYQLDFDYILITRNNYIEIRRIPGGLIANNTTVYIDYVAEQPIKKYDYLGNYHGFNASVLLFKNKFELYYRFSTQDFFKINTTDSLLLNYFTQNVVGTKIDFGIINFGVEYDDNNNTIMPYTMLRYFVNFQKTFRDKYIFLLNGNRQEYHLVNQNIDQLFSDIISKISFPINKHTYFNIGGMYRNQQGTGIDLNLLTGTAELTTNLRKLFISLRAELYRRNFINEDLYFKGGYITISRKF